MPSFQRAAYLAYVLLGSCVVVAPVLRELNPANWIRGYVDLSQFLTIELFLGLAAYWALQISKSLTPLQLSGNLLLFLVTACVGVWMTRFMGSEALLFLEVTPFVFLAGSAAVSLVLIGAARVAGVPLVAIVTTALVFGYAGQFVFEGALVLPTKIDGYLTYVVFGTDGLFGLALDIITNIVLVFVIFAAAFEIAGGSDMIKSMALRLAVHSRTGAIKACIIASGLFGTVSGTTVSNVMASGSFSIPSMRRIGVRNETAAGIEAAASTCGQIMPPVLGATAFFLADFVGVSYGSVVLASIGPALLCYFAFFRQADLVELEGSYDPVAEEDTTLSVLDLLYLGPVATMVFLLFQSGAYLTLAPIVGTTLCFGIALLRFGLRTTLKRTFDAVPRLIDNSISLLITAAAIGLLLGALYSTGLAISGAVAISKLGEDSNLIVALLLTAVSAFVLGMGVATVGLYILTATLLAPGLVSLGVAPMAAHFFVLMCGLLSMITPPVAFASLAASTLAKANFVASAWQAMRFGWILFLLPFMVVFQPGILMIGGWLDILWAFATTFLFVFLLTHAFLTPIRKTLACIFVGTCIVMQEPTWLSIGLFLSGFFLRFPLNRRCLRT